jgi:hypothetical protein
VKAATRNGRGCGECDSAVDAFAGIVDTTWSGELDRNFANAHSS